MPKKKDVNETAFDALQELISRDAGRDSVPHEPQAPEEKVSLRVKAGRKGGLMGGKTRAKNLSPAKRKKIAQKAARRRLGKDS